MWGKAHSSNPGESESWRGENEVTKTTGPDAAENIADGKCRKRKRRKRQWIKVKVKIRTVESVEAVGKAGEGAGGFSVRKRGLVVDLWIGMTKCAQTLDFKNKKHTKVQRALREWQNHPNKSTNKKV